MTCKPRRLEVSSRHSPLRASCDGGWATGRGCVSDVSEETRDGDPFESSSWPDGGSTRAGDRARGRALRASPTRTPRARASRVTIEGVDARRCPRRGRALARTRTRPSPPRPAPRRRARQSPRPNPRESKPSPACARVPSRATLALVLFATAACAVAYAGFASSHPRARGGRTRRRRPPRRARAPHRPRCVARPRNVTVDSPDARTDTIPLPILSNVPSPPSGAIAVHVRAVFIVPLLQAFVAVAAFLSALVAADRLFHVYVAVYWRVWSPREPRRPLGQDRFSAHVRGERPRTSATFPWWWCNSRCSTRRRCAATSSTRVLARVASISVSDSDSGRLHGAETRARVDDKVFEWRERGSEHRAQVAFEPPGVQSGRDGGGDGRPRRV